MSWDWRTWWSTHTWVSERWSFSAIFRLWLAPRYLCLLKVLWSLEICSEVNLARTRRWDSPSLSSSDVKPQLSDVIERRSETQIHRCDSRDSQTYSQEKMEASLLLRSGEMCLDRESSPGPCAHDSSGTATPQRSSWTWCLLWKVSWLYVGHVSLICMSKGPGGIITVL